MGELAKYVNTWNDWAAMPLLLVVAGYGFVTLRKTSLLVTAIGLLLWIAGNAVDLSHPWLMDPLYAVALALQSIGFLSALGGSGWFWLNDR